MAINHIHFNENNQYGQIVRSSLVQMESGDQAQAAVRDMLLQMINNADASSIANFDEVVKRLEVSDYVPNNAVTDAQRTVAKALFDEIDSAYSKTSGDGSVSGVHAARQQLYSKLRG
jgi:ribosomal protein L17